MQSVRVGININPRDIPKIVCSKKELDIQEDPYVCAISEALAEALGLEEFLNQPERIDELRRLLWEKDQRFEI